MLGLDEMDWTKQVGRKVGLPDVACDIKLTAISKLAQFFSRNSKNSNNIVIVVTIRIIVTSIREIVITDFLQVVS